MRLCPPLLLVLLLAPAALSAQEQAAPLTVQSNLGGQGAVARDASVEITFSRALNRPAERVAVFIDRTDVTGLFRGSAEGMSYERGVILLPRGEHELIVYLVETTSGTWSEVLRQGFQTLGRFGFQPGKTDPSLTAAFTKRLTEGYEPDSNAPAAEVENVDLQFRLSTEHVRENLKISSDAALVGATKREKALRFRELADSAPKLDLSSYNVQASNGPVEVQVGNISVGEQRHLVNRFSSRGASLGLRPSPRVDMSVAALNGSNEVGWGNVFGLDDSDHRVVTGTVGLEALSTPGALRVELTGMRGSVKPVGGFNQGVVNDAEESDGLAVRVTANAWNRRLRLDAGFSTSTFDNPEDPTLGQGQELVEVVEESSGARYVEASVDALKNLPLGGSRTARMTVGFKHERVDPLYRSLGAYARADRLQDQLDVRADVAGVGIQANYVSSRNNLDDVLSILTSKTERSQVSVNVPVARVVGSRSSWLPSLQYRADRTHQFGEGDPVNGGFSASHLPDQLSLNQSAQADWRWGKVTLGYRWNRSHQDNRQEGREDADLTVSKHGGNVRLSPHRTFDVSLDLGRERSENLQREETDETMRYGMQIQWQVFDRSSFSLRLSDTSTEDLLLTRRRANNQVDAQWSSVLPYMSAVQGQYFLRFTRNEHQSFNATFDQDDTRKAWWIDLGLNFTFF